MKNCFEIDSNSGQGEVDYFLTDHLGSVRVIVDGNGVVKERNDYYPFGARHARSDYSQLAANRFKYNGKEEQVTGDLKYLDYGARMYDSGLGRWFNIDPHVESYYAWSSFSYVGDNPLKYIDPTGMDWYEDKDGNKRWMRNQTSSTYEDDNGTIWIRTGESATFTFGNDVFVFGQNVDKEGNQTLFSNIFSVFSEVEPKGGNFSPKVLKGAFAIGATTSVADGPLPFGEAVGAALVVGATLYTVIDYGIYFFLKRLEGIIEMMGSEVWMIKLLLML